MVQKLAPHKPTVIVWLGSLSLIIVQLLLPWSLLNLLLAIVTVPTLLLSSYALWIIFFRPRSLQARLEPRRAHDPTIARKKPRWRYNTYQDPAVHLPNVLHTPIDPDFFELESLTSSGADSGGSWASKSGDSIGSW
ncbi:hypothetical protein [Herpetosiphon giganteus]|uniref:hypothetical protein n=1 Tax=Herpetosiphon giganteus TaxID=2029754 RepID=UPI00195772CB|nr:hypothetical protein [Herpetosiphon giganteus]MBM7845789.1 hypothetical protein [Herpetosiphon giganteus]